MNTMLDAALDYAARGWCVLPLHSPDATLLGGCSCRNPECGKSIGKHPRIRDWLVNATTDSEIIRKWWRMWPDANIGIATGNGLLVLDVDVDHDGAETLAALERLHGELPPTPTVLTGSGGLHIYLRAWGPIANTAGKLGPGLDTRGDGGYVVAPPSLHVSGKRYRWIEEASEADPPAWLQSALDPPRQRHTTDLPIEAGTSRRRAYVVAAIERECIELAHAPEGTRNNKLNEAAYSLARFIDTGEAHADKLIEVLTLAAEHAGLPPHEIERTIKSAFGARGVAV